MTRKAEALSGLYFRQAVQKGLRFFGGRIHGGICFNALDHMLSGITNGTLRSFRAGHPRRIDCVRRHRQPSGICAGMCGGIFAGWQRNALVKQQLWPCFPTAAPRCARVSDTLRKG
ncbi:hypothetical protein DSM101010T_30610 [Desulfovibrio subterraneus]|uniref:Uncharacterized protein n=1 Tax=Desulfovibrio subterraneus TaxID=2718620 RepID=A0A7J0BLZ1_9BACT|nr:hypothetical protein DSM101010T_30610 [Desulfovibrio subterraneus]